MRHHDACRRATRAPASRRRLDDSTAVQRALTACQLALRDLALPVSAPAASAAQPEPTIQQASQRGATGGDGPAPRPDGGLPLAGITDSGSHCRRALFTVQQHLAPSSLSLGTPLADTLRSRTRVVTAARVRAPTPRPRLKFPVACAHSLRRTRGLRSSSTDIYCLFRGGTLTWESWVEGIRRRQRHAVTHGHCAPTTPTWWTYVWLRVCVCV